jgi:hypothetical protein
VFGTPAAGEVTWARKLLHLPDETMLVLMDRGFDAAAFRPDVTATQAQFLVRLRAGRRAPVPGHLPDGSILSRLLGDQGAAGIGDLAAAHGIALHQLVTRRPSLEQAFMELTRDTVDYRPHLTAATTEARP